MTLLLLIHTLLMYKYINGILCSVVFVCNFSIYYFSNILMEFFKIFIWAIFLKLIIHTLSVVIIVLLVV